MDAEGAGTAGCVTAEIRLLAEVDGSGRPPQLAVGRRQPSPLRCAAVGTPTQSARCSCSCCCCCRRARVVGCGASCPSRRPLTCARTSSAVAGLPAILSGSSAAAGRRARLRSFDLRVRRRWLFPRPGGTRVSDKKPGKRQLAPEPTRVQRPRARAHTHRHGGGFGGKRGKRGYRRRSGAVFHFPLRGETRWEA